VTSRGGDLRVCGSQLKRCAEPHHPTPALEVVECNLSQLRWDRVYSIVVSSCAPSFWPPCPSPRLHGLRAGTAERIERERERPLRRDFYIFLIFKNIWCRQNLSKMYHNRRLTWRLHSNHCVTWWLRAFHDGWRAQLAVRFTIVPYDGWSQPPYGTTVPIFSNFQFY
jgi:hypothetical protein